MVTRWVKRTVSHWLLFLSRLFLVRSQGQFCKSLPWMGLGKTNFRHRQARALATARSWLPSNMFHQSIFNNMTFKSSGTGPCQDRPVPCEAYAQTRFRHWDLSWGSHHNAIQVLPTSGIQAMCASVSINSTLVTCLRFFFLGGGAWGGEGRVVLILQDSDVSTVKPLTCVAF